MCRSLVLGTVLLGVSASLRAQDPAVLQRRLERLETLRDAASLTATRADSARRERLDTVRSGGLTILALPTEAALVRQAAPIAWARLDTLYGDAAFDLLERPMLFYVMTRPIRYAGGRISGYQAVVAPENALPTDVAQQIARAGAAAILARADSSLATWFGTELLPRGQETVVLTRVYIDMATAPSIAVRNCFAGDDAACRAALGLVEEGDRLQLWFSAAERRAMVRRATEVQRVAVGRAADACLDGQSDQDCLIVLRSLPWIDPPLLHDARQSLARLALDAGGRGAYRRLAGGRGQPLAERLAAAARISSDSLIRRWRTAVLAARPRAVPIAAAGAWTALSWAVVFGLLALRSTRWR
jgi:hypothetical protein